MRESKIPEAIDYEIATEKGHCERFYDEEPNLNTMVFKNIDNSIVFIISIILLNIMMIMVLCVIKPLCL